MGTRGCVCFKVNEKFFGMYNHYDSYPEGLGINILEELRKMIDWKDVKENINNIELIKDEESKPTKEHIKKYSKYANTAVGGSMDNIKINTYYQLLRNLQGEITEYMNGDIGIMVDSSEFIKDTLFCEYYYVIDLDKMKFESYCNYDGENLLSEYKLNKLPSNKKYEKDNVKEE